MDIKQLKKELGLSQKDIAEFFQMSYASYANSTAKKRYEAALCKFYEVVKDRLKNEDY
jgi:transcriptional regulator with XRE-family HTH domain